MDKVKSTVEEISARLLEMIKSSSASELQKMAKSDALLPSEYVGPAGPVYGHWLGIMLVAGSSLKVTFRCFFNPKLCKVILARNMGILATEVADALVLDFIREFCNMTGGRIKRSLEESGVTVGLSLPFVTRGFDEVFALPAALINTTTGVWCLAHLEGAVVCKSTIEVLDFDAFCSIEVKLETPLSEEDSMEFL